MFVSVDPVGIGGNFYTQGLNVSFSQYVEAALTPYLYTRNDPVNFVDPWGLDRIVFNGDKILWQDDSGTPLRVYSGISGPHGKGALDPGMYTGHTLRKRTNAAMTCGDLGYSLNLDPMFSTDRTLLRIHPDGNIPGTLGCIGVNCSDARGLYNDLQNYFSSGNSTIDVHVMSPNSPLPK